MSDEISQSELFLAVVCGKERRVREWIEAGVDVRVRDEHGKTPLFYAVHSKQHGIANALIDATTDINATGRKGETILFHAVKYGNYDIVGKLIDARADINITDNQGQTPLFYAVRYHSNTAFLSAPTLVSSMGTNQGKKSSSLHLEVKYHNREIIDALIQAGADINMADVKGKTALAYAIGHHRNLNAQALIDAGADLEVSDNKKGGQTALFVAVFKQNIEMVQALVRAGAKINMVDEYGKTPLFYALVYDQQEIVCTLLENGADVNQKDARGQTPLFLAAAHHNTEAIRAILGAGADVNAIDNQGQTALFSALPKQTDARDCEAALELINSGTDVNIEDLHGKTVLFHSIKRSTEEFVHTLITRNALVNARDILGRTPLFYATTQSSAITRTLLDNGAKTHFRDNCHVDILSFYAEYCINYKATAGMPEMINLFQGHGVQAQTIVMALLNTVFHQLVRHHIPKVGMKDPKKEKEGKRGKKGKKEKKLKKEKKGNDLSDSISDVLSLAKQHTENKESIESISREIKELFEFSNQGSTAQLENILSCLVELDVDPNSADSRGNTALHYASRLPIFGVPQEETFLEICTNLEKSGARLNALNCMKESPLMHCLSYCEERMLTCYSTNQDKLSLPVEICRFLLNKHKDISVLNEVSSHGETVFHSIIKVVQAGLSLEKEENRQRIIQQAMEILQHLSSVDSMTHGRTAAKVNSNLDSPLHIWAALTLPTAQYYKKPEDKDDCAFEQLMGELLNHLLQCGAKVNARNENDETPLHLCKTWCAVQHLIAAGANVNDVDSKGSTPLLAAARRLSTSTEFQGNSVRIYPDVTLEPLTFFETADEIGVDLWKCDAQGESLLSILIKLEGFIISQALVLFACNKENSQRMDDVMVSLLNAICKDSSNSTHWKFTLVETIFKNLSSRKVNLDTALEHCCKNVLEVYTLEGRNVAETSNSIHWQIVELLRFYGTSTDSVTSTDSNSKAYLKIASKCPLLYELLTKPIDKKTAPIVIPWKSVSKIHKQKLEKVARGQESSQVQQSYCYHKNLIGQGSFGEIFAGIHLKDGREVAIKRITKSQVEHRPDVREIRNLVALEDCGQVVRYFDFTQDENFSFIILELMDGGLNEDGFFRRIRSMSKTERCLICKDVFMGLAYLHDREVLHRDLKPGNILYKTQPNLCLKITDFGLSRSTNYTGSTVFGPNVGTRCWMAPEVINACNPSKWSDIFSCGLVAHYPILSEQSHPFARPNSSLELPLEIHRTEDNILRNNMEGWDQSLPPEAAHLLKRMLEKNDKRRPSAAEALVHPMFWTEKKKMDFLNAVGNQPEFENERANPVTDVQKDLKAHFSKIVEHATWDDPRYTSITPIITEMTKPRTSHKGKPIPPRKYDTKSVVELVRFVRNAMQHVSDAGRSIPIRKLILEDFVFLKEFPNLVIEVFKAVTNHGWDTTREEIQYEINE